MLVRFPATPGTLVVLGQNSLFHIASVYPAVKWVPSINKAVLRVCALYAASCSGISPGGLKWFLYIQCLLGEEGRVSTSVDTQQSEHIFTAQCIIIKSRKINHIFKKNILPCL